MRVLIKQSRNKSVNHIFGGLARVMLRAGITPTLWDDSKKPAFDAFDELKPDIFMASQYDLKMADVKCIGQNPGTLFVLHNAAVPPKSYHDLKAYGAEPDFVFQTVKPERDDFLPCAMDLLNSPKPDTNVKLAITAIIDNHNEFKFLSPLFGVGSNMNISIFGDIDYGVSQYYGPCNGNERSIYHGSAMTILFNSAESNYRTYDCIQYGGLPLMQLNEAEQKIFKSTYPSFSTVEDIHKWTKYYAEYPQHRQSVQAALTQTCLSKHTYYHRAIKLFGGLGLEDIADKIEGMK